MACTFQCFGSSLLSVPRGTVWPKLNYSFQGPHFPTGRRSSHLQTDSSLDLHREPGSHTAYSRKWRCGSVCCSLGPGQCAVPTVLLRTSPWAERLRPYCHVPYSKGCRRARCPRPRSDHTGYTEERLAKPWIRS